MTNVLPLARPTLRQPDPEPRLQGRVRLYSRGVAAVFAGLAVLSALLLVTALFAIVFYTGDRLWIGSGGVLIGKPGSTAGWVTFGSVPLAHRLVYVVVGAVRYSPKVAILANQWALFRLYGRGVVFARANALRIRDTGLLLILDGVLPFACHVVLSTTGYEIDHRWMHLGSLQEVALGAVVVVIAEVMKVGREIEEERSLFV